MVKSNLTVNCEYFTLRFVCGIVNAIPYRVATSLAWLLARIAFAAGLKRKRTLERIRGAYPGISDREAVRIAVSSLANILKIGVELIRVPKLTREWMDEYVIDGIPCRDMLQKAVDRGKGVVIMVPHTGNWLMAAWAMAKYGLPIFAIGAHHRNPKINNWLFGQYGDLEVLDRSSRDTLGKIRDYLRQGRTFAIMPDLRVPKRDVEVDFLGGKANVSRAGAMFAVRVGCPIVVAAMSREGGKHVFHYLATLETEGRTAEDLTKEAMKLLADFVAKHPGDWYWFNKRWILQPPTK